MRAPPSQGANNLPTVEDNSEGSNDPSTDCDPSPSAPTPQQPRMKRSPYLSVMAGSTKESEDLVAMLSRPTGGDTAGFGGGLKRSSIGHGGNQDHHHGHEHHEGGSHQGSQAGGASAFFSLKRPDTMTADAAGAAQSPSHTVTPVSSAGGEFSDNQEEGTEGGGGSQGNANEVPPRRASTAGQQPTARPLPSLRSALRMGSRTDMAASQTQQQNETMRKNTSVTFSNTTKKASALGMVESQGNAGFDNEQQQQQQHKVGFAQVAQMRNFSSQQAPAASGGYTAEMMMKKSMSIAAPQFLLAHQNSVNSSSDAGTSNASFSTQGTTNNTQGGDGGQAGNASFPIYFSKLSEDEQQQHLAQRAQLASQGGAQQVGGGGIPVSNKPASPPTHARQRSKSMSTLRYYAAGAAAANLQSNITKDPAQQLLHAAGISGVAPVTARPSINGLNLTFRDMLDEGDGAEGDLNLRLRNQQWKDFRTFSSKFEESNPMMAAMMEVDETGSPVKETGSVGSTSTTTATTNASGIPLSGSKRTLTPSSLNSRTSNASSTVASQRSNAMVSNVPPLGRSIAGSHRATVSVNDLAVLRRAAARMKMNGPGPGNSQQQEQRTSQRLPGETLGGDMLSRIPSVSTNSATSDTNGGSSGVADTGLSPLAQMMAKNKAMKAAAAASGGKGAGGMGNRSGSFANQQQKDLFMQKFNMAMNQHSGSLLGGGGAQGGPNPALSQPFGQNNPLMGSMGNLQGGMGRRSRTVGAGLAYGCANMTTDFKSGFRMSKFNLGDLRKESSRLSEISSAGSSGGGKNEEWDLS